MQQSRRALKELKKARGGARPGAGMPKGYKTRKTIAKEEAREILRDMVKAELEPMTQAQIAAAKGLKFLVKRSKRGGKFEVVTREMAASGIFDDPDMIVEVWDKQPSTPAFTDLLNRTLDKPTESIISTVTLTNLDERIKRAADRKKAASK